MPNGVPAPVPVLPKRNLRNEKKSEEEEEESMIKTQSAIKE